MEEGNISRRGFLVGAAGAVAALGASKTLSAISPQRAYATVADCAVQYSGEEMASAPIEPVEAPESWDAEVDIVIAGSGGGLAAAARAVDYGASVILLEKRPDTGGGSKEASAWVVPGTKVQEALGMPDISQALVGTSAESAPFGSRYVQFGANIMDAAQRLVNWTVDKGFEWEPTTVLGAPGPVAISPAGSEVGGMTARAMSYVYTFLSEFFVEHGGDLRTKTALSGLVTDGDKVIGVQATDWDGNVTYLKANKGVLLATGGMGANREMLKQYIPTAYYQVKFSTSGTQDTGEGILMGLGAGAEFDGYDKFDEFDGGINGVDWNTYMYLGAVQMARQPWLCIDVHGERVPYLEGTFAAYTQAAKTLRSLPGNQGYVFWDSKYEEYCPTFKQLMCRLLLDAETMPDVARVPNALAKNDWREGVKDGIESGLICTADTIQGVAEQLGIDGDVAATAVDSWNEICAAGTDPEEKMPDQFLNPVVEGPFYGMALGSFMFSTHAGLAVDANSQVLNTKGKPISGLFASGNATGLPIEQTNGSCAHSAASACLAIETMLGTKE